MADKTQKWEDNLPGRFYVDKECILCSLCSDIAPETFKESPDGDHDYVWSQPLTPDQVRKALDALEQCPVDAIGQDGD